MRRVRRTARRPAGVVVSRAGRRLRRSLRGDRRRAVRRRAAAPAAGRICRSGRGPMRVLHAWIPRHREGAARRAPDAHPAPDSGRVVGLLVQVYGVSADLRSRRSRDRQGRCAAGSPTMSVIGVTRRRVDGRAKVTGQTRFADDVVLPRMVHCKLLRSTVPHARVVRIDTSRARAHTGVHLVLTGNDFPIPYGILPVSQDEHALAIDRVRFVGDPVAAVIARDELTAFEALDLIAVDYEPLRTFSGPDDSLSDDTPRIHDYGDAGNIHKLVSLRFGDVQAALAAADHVFEDTFFYEGNTQLPIEQHAAVAA